MDPENIRQLHRLRYELNLRMNLTAMPPKPPYVELHEFNYSEGGNILLVVPMGAEGYRVSESKGAD
jgi:hypothetical protein